MSAPLILIADRDPAFLEQTRVNLESEGYRVDVAPDGREALARSQSAPPDLIIVEVNLPRLDGWKLVKRVRALEGLDAVPVLFLSERSTETTRRQALKVGIDDMILKPVHPETLAFRVARALSRRYKVAQTKRTLQKAADTRRLVAAAAKPPAQAAAAPTPPPPPGPAASKPERAALSGDLEHVSLPTVLGMLDVEHKTGRLVMVHGHDGNMGWIELRAGRVVRARTDHGADGRDGIIEMLGWTAGAFQFHVEPVEGADEIGAVTTELLIEGARVADESARLVAVATPDPPLVAPPPPVPLVTGDADPPPPLETAAGPPPDELPLPPSDDPGPALL